MENNSKYDDVAYLVTDLCRINTDNEMKSLTELSVRMKQDILFRKDYLKYLKLKYVKAIPTILKGTYKKISFSALHKTILSQIEKNVNAKRYPLLSSRTRM